MDSLITSGKGKIHVWTIIHIYIYILTTINYRRIKVQQFIHLHIEFDWPWNSFNVVGTFMSMWNVYGESQTLPSMCVFHLSRSHPSKHWTNVAQQTPVNSWGNNWNRGVTAPVCSLSIPVIDPGSCCHILICKGPLCFQPDFVWLD